jgi:transcriptional regulator with XRE-family HTH domain
MGEQNRIGDKLKSIRDIRKMSVEELSSRAGINQEQLNKIEAGELIPSLSPLIKLSRVLGVRLGTLLDDHEDVGPIVTKSGMLPSMVRFSDKDRPVSSDLDFSSLAADKAGRHMEPFMIDIHPSSTSDIHPSAHEGEEFIHVMAGSVEILYGKETYQLQVGDSIYYDSIVPHHVHSKGGAAKILAVVYAP